MKVLIVGGAGYVGGALTEIMKLNYFDDTVVYDNLLFQEDYRKPGNFVFGDIRDREKLGPLLGEADVVVWLAALVGDGACEIDRKLTKEINDDSVKWLSEHFDGRIIFMSTCSVYGAQDGILDESSPTNPLSAYAQTKLEAEGHLKNKNAIIFRLGTLFGIGDEFSRVRLDLAVNTMTAKAVKEGKLDVFGGEQYRPLLHVWDVATAIQDAIYSDKTGIFNLHAVNMRIIDLAKEIESVVPTEINITETKFQDSRNYKVSSDKARKLLGFDPLESVVKEGIEEIAKLIGSGRIKDIDNPRYSNKNFLEGLNGTI